MHENPPSNGLTFFIYTFFMLYIQELFKNLEKNVNFLNPIHNSLCVHVDGCSVIGALKGMFKGEAKMSMVYKRKFRLQIYSINLKSM